MVELKNVPLFFYFLKFLLKHEEYYQAVIFPLNPNKIRIESDEIISYVIGFNLPVIVYPTPVPILKSFRNEKYLNIFIIDQCLTGHHNIVGNIKFKDLTLFLIQDQNEQIVNCAIEWIVQKNISHNNIYFFIESSNVLYQLDWRKKLYKFFLNEAISLRKITQNAHFIDLSNSNLNVYVPYAPPMANQILKEATNKYGLYGIDVLLLSLLSKHFGINANISTHVNIGIRYIDAKFSECQRILKYFQKIPLNCTISEFNKT